MRLGHTGLNSRLRIIKKNHATKNCEHCGLQETVEHVFLLSHSGSQSVTKIGDQTSFVVIEYLLTKISSACRTLDQLCTLYPELEGSGEFTQPVRVCFVDLEKASREEKGGLPSSGWWRAPASSIFGSCSQMRQRCVCESVRLTDGLYISAGLRSPLGPTG